MLGLVAGGALTGLAHRPAAAVYAKIVHQAREQARAEITAAAIHLANGGDQLIGGTLLQNIAAGAHVHALGQVVLVVVHGEEYDTGLGALLANQARSFKAAHAGHPDIH